MHEDAETRVTSWVRPRTDTAAWARAIEIGKRLDLAIEIANSQGCAERNGAFWVIDRSLKQHAGRAETLEGVLEILQRYEQHRPSGRPEPQSWNAQPSLWRAFCAICLARSELRRKP